MSKTKTRLLVLGFAFLSVFGLVSCNKDKTPESKTETFTINVESTNDGLYDDYSLKVDVTNGEKVNLLNLLKTKTNVETTTIKELYLNNVLLTDATSVALEDASTSEKLLIVYKDETPASKKLDTPVVSVNEDGLASWNAVPNALSYLYKINNNEDVSTTELSLQLSNNDVLVVKAVGDNLNYLESDYSTAVTYTKVEDNPTPTPTPTPSEEVLTFVGQTTVELGSLTVKSLTDLTNYVNENYSLTSSTDKNIVFELSVVSNTIVFGTPGEYSFVMKGVNKNTNKEITQTVNVLLKQEWLVKFYDLNNQVLYETIVSNGSSVTFKGETPTKDSTELKSYTFSKWDKNIDSVSSNLDLYPLFTEEVIAHTLTLVCDTNDIKTLVVPKNTKAELTTPTKLNHSFEGWYTDESLTTKFDSDTLVNKDLTLYAKFTKLATELTVEGNNLYIVGSLDNKDLTWLKSNFNNTNYVVKDNLGNVVQANFEIVSQNINFTTAGEYLAEIKVSHNNLQTTLFVTVKIVQQYTVTFKNSNDTTLYTTVVNKGETAVYEGETPTQTDPENLYLYQFHGWDKNLVNVTQDLTVKAVYEKVNNFIVVTLKDNDSNLLTVQVAKNGTLPSNLNVPPKEDYTLVGWYLDKELTQEFDITQKITTSLTLYAKYEVYIFHATYVTDDTTVTHSYPKTNLVGLLGYTPYPKENYEFVGWTDEKGNLLTVSTLDLSKPEMTLYAKWEVSVYTVKYDIDGKIETRTYNKNNVIGILNFVPNVSGYRFSGWTNQNGVGYTNSTLDLTKSEMTLYANLVLLQYNITFYLYKSGTGNGVATTPVVHVSSVKQISILNFEEIQRTWISNANGTFSSGYTFDRLTIVSASAGTTTSTLLQPITDFEKFVNATSYNVYFKTVPYSVSIFDVNNSSKTVLVDIGAPLSYLTTKTEFTSPTLPSSTRSTNYLTITFNNDEKYYVFEYENSSSTFNAWKTLPTNTNLRTYDEDLLENTIFRKTSLVTNGFPQGEILYGSDLDTGTALRPLKLVSSLPGSGNVNSNTQAKLTLKGFATTSNSTVLITNLNLLSTQRTLYAVYESTVTINLINKTDKTKTTYSVTFPLGGTNFSGKNLEVVSEKIHSLLASKNQVAYNISIGNLGSSAYTTLSSLKAYQLNNANVYYTTAGAPQTITYVTNSNETLVNATAAYGEKYTTDLLPELSNLYKINHTFLGWYSDEELTKKVSTYTKVGVNPTLYAKWAENITADVVLTYKETEYHQNTKTYDGDSISNLYDDFLVAVKVDRASSTSVFDDLGITYTRTSLSTNTTPEYVFGDEIPSSLRYKNKYFVVEKTLLGITTAHLYLVLPATEVFTDVEQKATDSTYEQHDNVTKADKVVHLTCNTRRTYEITVVQPVVINSAVTYNMTYTLNVESHTFVSDSIKGISSIACIDTDATNSNWNQIRVDVADDIIYFFKNSEDNVYKEFNFYYNDNLSDGIKNETGEFVWECNQVGEIYLVRRKSYSYNEIFTNETTTQTIGKTDLVVASKTYYLDFVTASTCTIE